MMLRDVVNDKVGRERSRVSLSRDTARVSLKFYVMTFVKFGAGKVFLGFQFLLPQLVLLLSVVRFLQLS